MKKNLVIMGAGFAGRHTYMSLAKSVKEKYNIIIIDKHHYFLFTPLLHEAATGGLDPHDVVEPITGFIDPETTFIQDSVVAIDYDKKNISFENHEVLSYEYLVMGLGSKTNFFETPGAQDRSFILKTLNDAQKLKDHFITLFQKTSELNDVNDQKKLLSMVIVGGGPTGVELAAEASHLFFKTFKRMYRGKLDVSQASITIVNGGDTLLRPFAKVSQDYAQRTLEKKGVKVMNNVRITEVTQQGAITADGECIEAHTVVWAAGVMPQVVDAKEPVAHDRHRLKVNEFLQLENHEEVFVLGDMALAPTDDLRGYPMLAQVAKQQGEQTARNISRHINAKVLKSFDYHQKGSLVSLGCGHAVVDMGKIRFHGFFAWLLWRMIYIVTFNSWTQRLKIFVSWFLSKREVTKI